MRNVFVNVMNVMNVLLFLFMMLNYQVLILVAAFLNHHVWASPIHHVPHHGLFRPLLKLLKLVISSCS